MEIELLFAALMALLPHVPQPMHGCMAQRHGHIIAQVAQAAATHGVPPAVLMVVGLLESHYGCAPGSGGCWGAPLDRRHRLTAGTPNQAAVALATSFRVCGTWRGALSRFRCGLCRCPERLIRGYTPGFAARLVERVHERAGLALPEGLGPAERGTLLARRRQGLARIDPGAAGRGSRARGRSPALPRAPSAPGGPPRR